MKLKAHEIYNMHEAIQTLSQGQIAMPMAYYVAKNTKVIKDEAAAIDEARQKLIMEYGKKNEDGSLQISEEGTVAIDDSKVVSLNEQLSKLFEAEVEIDITKIPLSTLNQINIPIASMEKLLPIITDDLNKTHECENKNCKCDSAELTLNENGEILSFE